MEILQIVDDKHEGNERLYCAKLRVGDTLVWLPFKDIPSFELLKNYCKRLFWNFSAQRDHYGASAEKIYHLLYECRESELDSLRKKYLTIHGLSLPKSSKRVIYKIIMEMLRNPASCDGRLDELRQNILVEKMIEKQEIMLANLKICEWQINLVSDNRKPIVISNDFDFTNFPTHLVYVNNYCYAANVKPDDVAIKCDCTSSADCNDISCRHYFGGTQRIDRKVCAWKEDSINEDEIDHLNPYDENGRVLHDKSKRIYECNKLCECNDDCLKRVVQKGGNLRLEIFKSWNGCGWGVRTLEDIPAHTFVTRYVGEVIPHVEGDKKKGVSRHYLFDLDFNVDENKLKKMNEPKSKYCPYTVDAYNYGNISRFINHSCDENLSIYAVHINNIFPELPEIAFFAKHDIENGEELSINYGSQWVENNKCKCVKCSN